jgi:hypothetical protein
MSRPRRWTEPAEETVTSFDGARFRTASLHPCHARTAGVVRSVGGSAGASLASRRTSAQNWAFCGSTYPERQATGPCPNRRSARLPSSRQELSDSADVIGRGTITEADGSCHEPRSESR